jgi:hypothetical protein
MTTENNIVEALIVRRLVTALLDAGLEITVNDGEEDCYTGRDPAKIFEAMMSTDEDVLITTRGSVWLIYGNGFDLISDYSVRLEEVIRPVSEWVERLSSNWTSDMSPTTVVPTSIQSILLALEAQ